MPLVSSNAQVRNCALAGSVCVLAFGCDQPPAAPGHWTAQGDSTLVVAVERPSEVCQDCIDLTELVVLGDTVGPGYISEGTSIVRDSLGNYWVGERDGPRVFGPTGKFIRQVGRAGQGPMEFQRARATHVDAAGNIHIFDSSQRRETVITSNFHLLEERQLPWTIRAAARLDDSRYVVNMWLPTPENIGLPLHIINGGKVELSFGLLESETSGPVTHFTNERVVTVDKSGHVFSARYYDYFIEVWTPEGKRIRALRGPTLNTHEVLPGPVSMENPAPSRIYALNVDEAGFLWVASYATREDWHDGVVETVREDGNIGLWFKGSFNEVWEGRLDVIDLNTSTIIATSRQDILISTLLGDELGAELRLLPNGTPQLAVWQLSLQR